MRRRVFPIFGVLLLVAGCAGSSSQADLAKACQFRPCVCKEEGALLPGLAATRPVTWRPNGEAGCPEGFVLRLQQEDSTSSRRR